MNIFIWVGVVILLLGWFGLIVIALSYKFEEDSLDKLHPSSLPNNNPDNPFKTGTLE